MKNLIQIIKMPVRLDVKYSEIYTNLVTHLIPIISMMTVIVRSKMNLNLSLLFSKNYTFVPDGPEK